MEETIKISLKRNGLHELLVLDIQEDVIEYLDVIVVCVAREYYRKNKAELIDYIKELLANDRWKTLARLLDTLNIFANLSTLNHTMVFKEVVKQL